MENKKQIDRYIQYFSKQIDEILTVSNNFYQKILFSCLLDTVAQGRFPKKTGGNRIKAFISQYANASILTKVSWMQLSLNLKYILSDKEKMESALYKETKEQISRFKYGEIHHGDEIDPSLNILNKNISKKETKAITHARYDDLFCTYRNSLVHNFREPAYGMDSIEDKNTPYYHGIANKSGIIENSWQLVFPVGFFKKLCVDSLKNVSNYFEQNDIDPFDSYTFGDMWTPEGKLRVGKKR